MGCKLMLINRIYDDDHPYSHIEGPVHLSIGYPSYFLKQAENWQHWPGASSYLGGGSGWQDSWDVLEQSSTGYVRQAFYDAKIQQTVKGSKVTPVGLEQLLARGRFELLDW